MDDPIRRFREWLDLAVRHGFREPNAMALATGDAAGRPSVRMVLLKGVDDSGFVFFTNYESRKGRELAANPRASLAFYWDALERQVRIEGSVERVGADESDAYFASRPRGSRIAAAASPQSEPIPDRESLERRYRELDARFPGDTIPRPPHWGGYRLVPESIEFWEGRPDRMHDRTRYRREPGGDWRVDRLAP